jgi:hypothetical protein
MALVNAFGAIALDATVQTSNTKLTSLDSKLPSLLSGRIPVDGSGVTQPISVVTLPLPTGAATESTLSALNVKFPSLVSGRVPVDGSGVTQPISASSLPLPTGAATSALQTTGNTSLSSIDGKLAVPRTPTTTSVASSASSATLLASNTNRRGVSINNVSTATLYLSFSTPATTANSFLAMAPNSFLLLDQQMVVTGAIYGIWSAANGTAQVTEYV